MGTVTTNVICSLFASSCGFQGCWWGATASLHFPGQMLAFCVDPLEFLLALYFISSTLVLNKEKIKGKSYLNKSLSVKSYYSKAAWTYYQWFLKSPMGRWTDNSYHYFQQREGTNLLVLQWEGYMTLMNIYSPLVPFPFSPKGKQVVPETWVPLTLDSVTVGVSQLQRCC